MTQLKIVGCCLILLLNVHGFTHHSNHIMTFTAKFYDEQGRFIGTFSTADDNSPIYVIAYERLFPYKAKEDYKPITPLEIVQLVGTEIISDRHTMIVELNLHVGVCKLPPKSHRDEIRKIIEDVHLDPQNPLKMDSVDYEIGGCGYHNNAGELLHLRAVDGEVSNFNSYPSVAVFNAIDYASKVDSNQQLTTDSGSKLISERRVEYTWHTHPPRTNGLFFQQRPSLHDYSFGNNYQYIKQHFLISLKYKYVYYFGFGTRLQRDAGQYNPEVFNFKMTYDTFFSLE
jgi:hypothetical protein